MPSRKVAENPFDNPGLSRFDLAGAAVFALEAVPERQPTAGLAVKYPAQEAAFGLLLKVDEVLLPHGSNDPCEKCGNLAGGHGVQCDAVEREFIVECGDIGDPPAKAVEAFR